MGKLGCTISGTLDDSRFSEPMPWIGLYVVAASAACAAAMAADAFHGLRYRKFWFPCKYFALNATTLTLIGVAVKLSVDLNTPMPRVNEQLAKLSSTTFLCTVISNSLPSLGTMETKELMMNVVALGILVITVIVNVCIQLGTGVIYSFWIEYAVILFLMVVLFAITISSALAIPVAKYYFDRKYSIKFEMAKKECDKNCQPSIARKLRDDLMRYWMMAHTCNPQFVTGRLATCTASGAFGLLSALTLAEAMLRSYLMPWCFRFCKGESDYKWSAMLILVTQTIAVVVGTIAPASRWFIAIKFMCPKKAVKSHPNGFSAVERYWVKQLEQLKECPMELRIGGRHGRRLVYGIKHKILDLCIWVQKGMVILSKLVRILSILIASQLLRILSCCKKLVRLVTGGNNIIRSCNTELDSNSSSHKVDLSSFVLHLQGEEALIEMMMHSDRDATEHWIRIGRKQQPRYITRLLEKSVPSQGFEGVLKFDNIQIPSLDYEEPPNSWALPVVTLTSIAIAISNTDFHLVKELIQCVHEGLTYIRIVEKNIDVKGNLNRIRQAAEIVWVGVDLHYKWLNVDLREMALQEKSPKDIISELSEIAKHKFMEQRKIDPLRCLTNSSSKWPVKLVAANSMYRICQTLLFTQDSISNKCNKVMLERITSMITDIMGACLTNLQHAISIKCHQSTIEHREESVRYAILLLGKTEKLLDILGHLTLPSSDPKQLACINEWRALSLEKDHLVGKPSPTTRDPNFTTSSELYLNID